MNIHVDIQGAAELAAAWAQAPQLVTRELTAAAWAAELLLEREIKELTPVGVTGLLRQSISAREPQVLADQVIGVVATAAAHAVPVELGTRPHYPPIQPLVDWVEHKLGIPADDAREVAFLIQRKIGRQGTKGALMFRGAFEANRAQVQKIFADAFRRIRDGLAKGGTA